MVEFITTETSRVICVVAADDQPFAEVGRVKVTVTAADVIAITVVVRCAALGTARGDDGIFVAIVATIMYGADWCKILLYDLTGSGQVHSWGHVKMPWVQFLFIFRASAAAAGNF